MTVALIRIGILNRALHAKAIASPKRKERGGRKKPKAKAGAA
jgi:hypothetical protein